MIILCLPACTISHESTVHPAMTAPLPIAQLKGYRNYDPRVKYFFVQARHLSQKHLTYRFGSADPRLGGMDCSGVIYYLLHQLQIQDVPRQAYGIYRWTLKYGTFHQVHSNNLRSRDFSHLRPGDLLFWSGTYKGAPPISHVMIYLGNDYKQQPLMFGATEGFPYHGKLMWGVSVYDFIYPNPQSPGKLVGYSSIPHMQYV